MFDFLVLAHECAPTVAPQTMAAIINVESGKNPYAIGVVGGRLERQPKNHQEAIATAKALTNNGWNFSIGVAQVNRYNLPKYAISLEQAFDACTNIRIGSKILEDCYVRATKNTPDAQVAIKAAFSCYYSGNFTRGFQPDVTGKPSYVEKVLANADVAAQAIPVVPNIQPKGTKSKAVRTEPGAHVSDQQEQAAPADNAPVLLRRSNDTVQLKPIETNQPSGQEKPDTTQNSKVIDRGAVNKEIDLPRSSAIVF
jgi:type IV secretion system protein VirB1